MLRRLQAAAASAAVLTPSYHHTAVAGLVTSSMIRLARDTIFFREIHVVLLIIRDELSPWLKGAQIFIALALRIWCQKSVTFFEFKRQRPLIGQVVLLSWDVTPSSSRRLLKLPPSLLPLNLAFTNGYFLSIILSHSATAILPHDTVYSYNRYIVLQYSMK